MDKQQNFVAETLAQIIEKFATTGSVSEAYDAIMGEGAYLKLAGDVYDAAKTAA